MADKEDLFCQISEFLETSWSERKEYTLENVYLFGSRLYGVATKKSDFDFIILVKGVCISVSPQNRSNSWQPYYPGPLMFENDLLNLNLYHVDYWHQLLEENVVWVMITTWFPDEYSYQ